MSNTAAQSPTFNPRPIWRSATGRARWAAIGAALAVTLGAGGGFGLAQAAVTSGDKPIYVPVTPCRLVDTRPASTVGPRATPIGDGETHMFSAHGTNGDCTIPTGALAVATNVTAVGATAGTFLTFWPSDDPRPEASSLNPGPGQRPTPNAVTTPVSDAGQFSIYNNSGQVNVIIDVVGYYADHEHPHDHTVAGPVDTVPAATVPVDTASRTRQISLGIDQFRPRDQNQPWTTGVGQIYIPAGASSPTNGDRFYAPLVLPTGAVITGATARIHDNAFLNLRVEIERKGDSIAASDLFEVDTSGAVDDVRDFELIQQGSTPRVIDNTSASYYVEVSLAPNPLYDWSVVNSELRLASIVIDYELPA